MVLIPTRFRLLNSILSNKDLKILDVGAGSHSATITKKWYPKCEYHGIDRVKNYQNSMGDIQIMDTFYEMDVTMLEFSSIPDRYFDLVIMSHIIEHLSNGEKVIEGLVSKLKYNGLLYIEFPSVRSLNLPSMKGTLNFYDDPTHCRVFERREIEGILKLHSFEIIYSRVRRDWVRIICTPLLILNSLVKYGFVAGSVFWDITGFAEIVIARKK